MPKAPENPEPHGCTEELTLDHLGPGELGKLSVPGLNVHTATSMTDSASSRPRAEASEEAASAASERRQPRQSRHASPSPDSRREAAPPLRTSLPPGAPLLNVSGVAPPISFRMMSAGGKPRVRSQVSISVSSLWRAARLEGLGVLWSRGNHIHG